MVACPSVIKYGKVVAVRLVLKRRWFLNYVTVEIKRERFKAATPLSDFYPDSVSGWLEVHPTSVPELTDIQEFLNRQNIREDSS